MANIENLSQAVKFLHEEFVNEINNHTNFQNPEVSELADIIVDIFTRLEKEINEYND